MTDVTCDRRYGILGSTVVRYSPADSVDTNDERDSGNWLYAGICCLAGRSGLAVACLTVVREVLGSNHSVGSYVCRKNQCDLQPWARAVCTCPAVPRSTQPSTLHGTVNE